MSFSLESLNPIQQRIVLTKNRNNLVLAGAGSGKTRVLVHRIAWLLQTQAVSAQSILAVTFSNKAAAELRARTAQLLSASPVPTWIGTFHGLAHRLLRQHSEAAGLSVGFQIIDADDQVRLIKTLVKESGLDEKRWTPRQVATYISQHKERGLTPSGNSAIERRLAEIYQQYQERCQRSNLVDFTELLLRANQLWLTQPELLSYYQAQFSHCLVDEFQDTNELQYRWVKMLAGQEMHCMVVGDDDQSIYGWRGAQIDNLNHFVKEFVGVEVLRLEQNYRSTPQILNAANAVIAHNRNRFKKALWSTQNNGEKIKRYAASDEIQEAYYVVNAIQELHKQGVAWAHCAILYRNNALSRIFEELLTRQGLPYHVYGGVRFFDRQEVKDLLAYLRLVMHRHDDAALERIINVPTRGIGEKSIEEVRALAKAEGSTLWDALRRTQARSAVAIGRFVALIEDLDRNTAALDLTQASTYILHHSGLWDFYKADQKNNRTDNLEELVNATRYFTLSQETNTPRQLLQEFLSTLALDHSAAEEGAPQKGVQLMTLHAAKGLEFPQVFIVGLEEGLFPSRNSWDDPKRLEEERRLAYVGITRAKQHLTLTYAEKRQMYGRTEHLEPSRFLSEMPQTLVEEVRHMRTLVYDHCFQPSPPSSQRAKFCVGARLQHKVFGKGTLLTMEGSGEQQRLQVAFETQGTKWLLASLAPLEVVE